jgi:hypothetical protein
MNEEQSFSKWIVVVPIGCACSNGKASDSSGFQHAFVGQPDRRSKVENFKIRHL